MADVVHMLQETTGSPNGFDVYTYHEGENYKVGDPKMSESLALAFVENGSAELKSGRAEPSTSEAKHEDGSGKVLSPSATLHDEKQGDKKR